MHLAINYIKHYFKAHHKKGYGIHSPFVFHLVTSIIHDYTPFYCFENIEQQRIKMLANTDMIEVTDFGSGSRIHKNNFRKVGHIAKHSVKPTCQAQLLFRLVNHFNAKHILEIGTSLGITSSYLASVNSKSKVITLEGCPKLSSIAQQNFADLHLKNIKLITGEFNQTLPLALKELEKLDFVFFDGNHNKNSTLEYYEQCLRFAHELSVFIFDDIHLNPDMEQFWNTLIQREEITVTLDLFHIGIVFFRKGMTKQNFLIRF